VPSTDDPSAQKRYRTDTPPPVVGTNPPPPGPPLPFVGPITGDKGNTPGLRGTDRFRYVMSSAPPGMTGEGTSDRDEWILSIPDDPTDPEFSKMLADAKVGAAARNRERSYERTHGGKHMPSLADPNVKGPTVLGVGALTAKGRVELQNPKPGPDPGSQPTLNGPPPTGPNQKQKNAKLDEQEAKRHRFLYDGRPVIQGVPATAESILGQAEENPGGAPSPFLEQFARDQEINLNPDYTRAAVKTGDYVYVGERDDPGGGKGYTRAVYVYAKDAQAQIAKMPPDQIKKYQAKMGLPQTGLVDPELQQAWDYAVEVGRGYARAGMKVELKFIFETLLGSGSLSKGGGGGGGRFAGETPEDMAGVDYYQAMMQVLGDISGVK